MLQYQDISSFSLNQRAILARGLVDVSLLDYNAPYNSTSGMIDGKCRGSSNARLLSIISPVLGPEGNTNFMSAIALLDLINGTRTYQNMVVDGLTTIMRLNSTANFQT